MALGIWARLDSWRSITAFTFSNSFSSSRRLAFSWFSSGSILREEFFKLSISYASSLASRLLEFFLANKASWLDRFLWAFFTFGAWSSIMDKGDKMLIRSGDELSLMAKRLFALNLHLGPNRLYSSQTLAICPLANFWYLLIKLL